MTREPDQAQRLGVRVRRTLLGEGEARRATVYCHVRERSLAVDACMRCEQCAGLGFDSSGSSVRCRGSFDAPEEPRVAREPQMPPKDVGALPVAVLMTREVMCVREDASVESIKDLLGEHEISGAPVVDADGKLIGVVSKTDFLRSQGDAVPRTVADIMTRVPLAIPEGASVGQAAALMAYEGVHRLPVTTEGEEVIGVISSLDVLRCLAWYSGFLVPRVTQRQR